MFSLSQVVDEGPRPLLQHEVATLPAADNDEQMRKIPMSSCILCTSNLHCYLFVVSQICVIVVSFHFQIKIFFKHFQNYNCLNFFFYPFPL